LFVLLFAFSCAMASVLNFSLLLCTKVLPSTPSITCAL
jgi:hypothetical protein